MMQTMDGEADDGRWTMDGEADHGRWTVKLNNDQ